MALPKLRRFFQLALPAELRKPFHLAEGDDLEAEAIEEGILLK
jgi:AbrB family looped-hinge helix DNA binding protein